MAEKVTLRVRAEKFSTDIVLLCRRLRKNGVENSMVHQLQRAGTSVGANVAEAKYAQGRKDFASKYQIALKECNETEHWLTVLHRTESLPDEDYAYFKKECIEICRILVSSVRTAKKNAG